MPLAAFRYVLGVLLAFLALNAFAGGYYGMAGARGVPTQWLEGSPFHSYFVPGLILFAIVGCSSLLAAVAVLTGRPRARRLVIATGSITLGWIAVQLAIIGYVSWMQPTLVIIGVLILRLATLLE
jgi:hypothetical protein